MIGFLYFGCGLLMGLSITLFVLTNYSLRYLFIDSVFNFSQAKRRGCAEYNKETGEKVWKGDFFDAK